MANDVYMTKDLPEAAALLSHHQKLLRLEKEGNHLIFVFQDRKTCEKVANAFLNRELIVDAMSYAECLRILKNKIFGEKGKEKP